MWREMKQINEEMRKKSKVKEEIQVHEEEVGRKYSRRRGTLNFENEGARTAKEKD